MTPKEKLQLILDRFKEQIKPEEFKFSSYVTEFNKTCGTVCCILGWFPKLFPKSGFYWHLGGLEHETEEDYSNILAALTDCPQWLVDYLFYGHNPKNGIVPYMDLDVSYEQVIENWQYVIDNFDDLISYRNIAEQYFLE